MSMPTRKLLVALAAAGVVAASGSAFTGGGLTSSAGSEAFVGGNVVQNVVGATVTGVAYDTNEATNTIASVTVTFADALVVGKEPTLVFGGTGAQPYTCTAVAADKTSTCTPTGAAAANTVSSTTITVA